MWYAVGAMRLLIVVMALCCLQCAPTKPPLTKSTWGGLEFGMTEVEARTALKDRTLIPSSKADQPYDRDFYIPFVIRINIKGGLSGGWKSKVTPVFSIDSKRLVHVNLWIDDLDTEMLIRELKVKYGNPAVVSTDNSVFIWSSDNQRIQLSRSEDFGQALVTYEPIQDDL